jgi:uncharacterized protein YdcH (DUF465 family)
MTEAQFVAILGGFAITVLASIGSMLTALLINNSRLSDLKTGLEARIIETYNSLDSKITETRNTLDSKITALDSRITETKDTLRAEIKAGDAAIISQMAIHQMDLISKIAELDNRITHLER